MRPCLWDLCGARCEFVTRILLRVSCSQLQKHISNTVKVFMPPGSRASLFESTSPGRDANVAVWEKSQGSHSRR